MTDNKWIFLKVTSNYSKFLRIIHSRKIVCNTGPGFWLKDGKREIQNLKLFFFEIWPFLAKMKEVGGLDWSWFEMNTKRNGAPTVCQPSIRRTATDQKWCYLNRTHFKMGEMVDNRMCQKGYDPNWFEIIEQCIIDTNAEKQLSEAATDV